MSLVPERARSVARRMTGRQRAGAKAGHGRPWAGGCEGRPNVMPAATNAPS